MSEKQIEIYTEITQKEIETALADEEIPSKKRWNIISGIEGNKKLQEEKEKIKNGIKIKFDIRLITRGFIEELPNYEIAKIGKIQEERLNEYWDEIEERDKIMKTILRGLVDESFDKQTEQEIKGYE